MLLWPAGERAERADLRSPVLPFEQTAGSAFVRNFAPRAVQAAGVCQSAFAPQVLLLHLLGDTGCWLQALPSTHRGVREGSLCGEAQARRDRSLSWAARDSQRAREGSSLPVRPRKGPSTPAAHPGPLAAPFPSRPGVSHRALSFRNALAFPRSKTARLSFLFKNTSYYCKNKSSTCPLSALGKHSRRIFRILFCHFFGVHLPSTHLFAKLKVMHKS